MNHATRILRRRWSSLSTLVTCAGRYWSSDEASTTGAALAFYCAFSLAPLIVILITFGGWLLGANQAYGEVSAQLAGLFGPSTAKVLMGAVQASQQTKGMVSTVVSVVTLIIGATSVLTALESALNRIWASGSLQASGVWGWIRSRLLSFGFILTLGFLLLISLTVSTALSNLSTRVSTHYAPVVGLFGALDFLASLLIISLLFTLIFRYMPAKRTHWSVAISGGALTAILFELGRWAVGLYLAHSTQPSAFGAAASFAALLLWLYYTAQIFLFGAEFTACLAGVHADQDDGKGDASDSRTPTPTPPTPPIGASVSPAAGAPR
jgi:membrane protein